MLTGCEEIQRNEETENRENERKWGREEVRQRK
jgi:hypothetical protein